MKFFRTAVKGVGLICISGIVLSQRKDILDLKDNVFNLEIKYNQEKQKREAREEVIREKNEQIRKMKGEINNLKNEIKTKNRSKVKQ